jgi:hypothetical protein
MCKCKEKACVDGVEKAMAEWSDKNKPKDGKKVEMSKDEETKVAGIMKEMSDCKTKATPPPAMDPAAGGTPPAGDMKKDEPAPAGDMKKDDTKKDEPKKDAPK